MMNENVLAGIAERARLDDNEETLELVAEVRRLRAERDAWMADLTALELERQKAVARAEAERERCAKVAETYWDWAVGGPDTSTCRDIAERLRALGDE